MISELAASYDPLGAHLEDPFPFYARARRTEPVFYSPRVGAWVVTRHRDVDAVLKDDEAFSSANSLRPMRTPHPATLAVFADGYPPRPDHVTSDGAVHRRLRAPYARRLTAPHVRRLEPAIERRAGALVDAFAGDGEADLIGRFASPLPVQTAADLFGIEPADVPTAKAGSEALFELGSVAMPQEREVEAARRFVALQRLIARYARARRRAPAGDLISEVVAALAPGDEPLTADQEAEVVGSLAGTLGAGHITTTDAIGNAMRQLLLHRDQWELLCRRPGRATSAAEETLRFECPVPTIFRLTTCEAVIGGVTVPPGADVLVAFISANRDEERFPDPDRLDITRPPNRHLAFGAGVHTCVGALLARVQLRIALRLLAERLPGLRLAGERTMRMPSINSRGSLELRVRW